MQLSHDFILDENVSKGIKKLLVSKGIKAQTVQELSKHRIKNSDLLKFARDNESILITYDKDFINLKKELNDSLILIDIHPLIDENVIPAFDNFLNLVSISDLKNNFIIIYENTFRIKKKL